MEIHKLQLRKTYPTGAEEWGCPACDYIVLVEWEPRFRTTVLVRGERVVHAGMKAPDAVALPKESQEPVSNPQWERWLNDLDLTGLG